MPAPAAVFRVYPACLELRPYICGYMTLTLEGVEPGRTTIRSFADGRQESRLHSADPLLTCMPPAAYQCIAFNFGDPWRLHFGPREVITPGASWVSGATTQRGAFGVPRRAETLDVLFNAGVAHNFLRVPADALTEEQLADDETSFDRLPEADVVRDEQVHAWQQQCFAERFQLVCVKPNPGAVRRLKQVRVRGGNGVPSEGSVVGGEELGRVELASRQLRPVRLVEPRRVELALPQDLQFFTLGIVLKARETDQRVVTRLRRRVHILDQVSPRTDADDLADSGRDVDSEGHETHIWIAAWAL